jgi:DNA-directed RNA polymerase subunit RPC12/RpoP
MTNFICADCNYRFESKFVQPGKKCPYCGKDRVIKEPNAEELLDEE